MVVVLCVLVGVLVGPFLNALIAAVPDKDPVAWPSLRAHPPIAYWFTSAAAEDPVPRGLGLMVEVGTPLLFALAGLRWGPSWVVVPYLLLFAVLMVVSVIDIEHYRIPDRIVFPALAVSIPLIVVVSIVEGVPEAMKGALVGAAVYFLMLFVAHLVYPKGMGFGDVKLALVMGLYLGWIYTDVFKGISLVLFALMIGCLLGVIGGGIVALVRRRNAEFPFGPALAASTIVAILFSDQILRI